MPTAHEMDDHKPIMHIKRLTKRHPRHLYDIHRLLRTRGRLQGVYRVTLQWPLEPLPCKSGWLVSCASCPSFPKGKEIGGVDLTIHKNFPPQVMKKIEKKTSLRLLAATSPRRGTRGCTELRGDIGCLFSGLMSSLKGLLRLRSLGDTPRSPRSMDGCLPRPHLKA